eukprot:symbB.v1.2.016345.t1/scaffold1222.1/size194531/19
MAFSRRMLPPLGRKDSKGLCEEQTKASGPKNEPVSKGSSERRRSASVCQVEAPKRPLGPLRVHIEDIEVEDLHQGATLFLPVFHSWQVSWWLPDAEQKHIMIEPLGSSAEDSSL